MDNNWSTGRAGGGLDGGYTGSLDHAISNLHVGRSRLHPNRMSTNLPRRHE